MAQKPERQRRWDVALMLDDMALEGLNKLNLAKRAGVADQTVIRFLNGSCQTNKTAKKLASALGYAVRRYLISQRDRERVA